MFKTIKESFNITNKNIIIATPLIFFSLISNLYLIFSSGGNNIALIFSGILLFLMFVAFFAGWFMMITKAVKNPDVEDKHLIMEFPAGVGEYFLAVLIMVIKIIIVTCAIFILAILAGKKLIGGLGINYEQFAQATANVETLKTFLSSLDSEQLVKMNQWNILLFFTIIINYFILMFFPAAIFFKRKNPFIAFWISLKDVFGHNFFKNVGLFTFIFVIYTALSVLSTLFGKNIPMHFIMTLINFYYLTFVGILIFNYYYSNFAKIGSNIDESV